MRHDFFRYFNIINQYLLPYPGGISVVMLHNCRRAETSGSVGHFERRAILRPRAPVIVDARGGDVGVAEPFLHLGDVGLVVERVGGGGRA